jgi:hypothetical protein
MTLAAGSKSVALAASFGAATPIAVGDRLLIIQMQDTDIDSTNTGSYGDGVAGDPASGASNLRTTGQYEFITATNAVVVGGGTLNFSGGGSGGGLVTWTIAAPGSARSFDVPDLRAIPGDFLSLQAGEIDSILYTARLDNFTYGKLRYGNLTSGSWSAYAFDFLHGTY